MIRSIIQYISLPFVCIFTFQSVALAVPNMASVEIPIQAGTVVRGWDVQQKGNEVSFVSNRNRPVVFVVQDAHDNFSVQKNIEHIISSLLPSLAAERVVVGVEGSYKKVSLEFLRKYPFQSLRQKTSHALVRDGYITGAESAVISNDKPFDLFGVEDQKTFNQNLHIFQSIKKVEPRINQYLKGLYRVIEVLEKNVWSPELHDFHNAVAVYRDPAKTFHSYVMFLWEQAQMYDVDLYSYTHMQLFREILALSAGVDYVKLNDTIATLVRCVNESGVQRIFVPAPDAHVFNEGYYRYMQDLCVAAEKLSINVEEQYPLVSQQLVYYRKYALLDMELFLQELKRLETDIKNAIATTFEERQLIGIRKHMDLFARVFRLQATRMQVQTVRGNIEYNRFSKVMVKLMLLAQKYGVQTGFYKKRKVLEKMFDEALTFYDVAESRDGAMVHNLLKRMHYDEKRYGIMVVGGYHVAGVEKALADAGVASVIIAPMVDDMSQVAYTNRMLGGLTINDAHEKVVSHNTLNALFSEVDPAWEQHLEYTFDETYLSYAGTELLDLLGLPGTHEAVSFLNENRNAIIHYLQTKNTIGHDGAVQRVMALQNDISQKDKVYARIRNIAAELTTIRSVSAEENISEKKADSDGDIIVENAENIPAREIVTAQPYAAKKKPVNVLVAVMPSVLGGSYGGNLLAKLIWPNLGHQPKEQTGSDVDNKRPGKIRKGDDAVKKQSLNDIEPVDSVRNQKPEVGSLVLINMMTSEKKDNKIHIGASAGDRAFLRDAYNDIVQNFCGVLKDVDIKTITVSKKYFRVKLVQNTLIVPHNLMLSQDKDSLRKEMMYALVQPNRNISDIAHEACEELDDSVVQLFGGMQATERAVRTLGVWYAVYHDLLNGADAMYFIRNRAKTFGVEAEVEVALEAGTSIAMQRAVFLLAIHDVTSSTALLSEDIMRKVLVPVMRVYNFLNEQNISDGIVSGVEEYVIQQEGTGDFRRDIVDAEKKVSTYAEHGSALPVKIYMDAALKKTGHMRFLEKVFAEEEANGVPVQLVDDEAEAHICLGVDGISRMIGTHVFLFSTDDMSVVYAEVMTFAMLFHVVIASIVSDTGIGKADFSVFRWSERMNGAYCLQRALIDGLVKNVMNTVVKNQMIDVAA